MKPRRAMAMLLVMFIGLSGALCAENVAYYVDLKNSYGWSEIGGESEEAYAVESDRYGSVGLRVQAEESGELCFYIKATGNGVIDCSARIWNDSKFSSLALTCSDSWTGYVISVSEGDEIDFNFGSWGCFNAHVRFTSPGAAVSVATYVKDRTVGGAKYSYWRRDGKAERVACELMEKANGEFALPTTIDGLQVVSIRGLYGGEYKYQKGITSIVIPEGVEEIESWVFYNDDDSGYPLDALQKVVLPESLRKIGRGAFAKCSGLTSIVIPNGVVEIGECVFRNCTGLTSVNLPTSALIIDYDGDVRNSFNRLFSDGGEEGAPPYYARLKEIHLHGNAPDWDYQMPQLPADCVIYVEKGTAGWGNVPGTWHGQPIKYETGLNGMGMENIKGGLDGSQATTFRGVVHNAEGAMCGLASVTVGKASKRGTKISGYIMLEDGKKYTIKATTNVGEDGRFNITSSTGKLGALTMVVGSNGFAGTVGPYRISSADVGENTGILKATVKMNYFDAKTGKIKTKNITLGGIASEGEAIGTLNVKGVPTKRFAAEIE